METPLPPLELSLIYVNFFFFFVPTQSDLSCWLQMQITSLVSAKIRAQEATSIKLKKIYQPGRTIPAKSSVMVSTDDRCAADKIDSCVCPNMPLLLPWWPTRCNQSKQEIVPPPCPGFTFDSAMRWCWPPQRDESRSGRCVTLSFIHGTLHYST